MKSTTTEIACDLCNAEARVRFGKPPKDWLEFERGIRSHDDVGPRMLHFCSDCVMDVQVGMLETIQKETQDHSVN